MFQTLDIEYQPQTATLWLARPESRNALDPTMIGEIRAALAELAADTSVRALLVGGRGGTFCAGADLRWMQQSAESDDSDNHADALALAEMLRTLYTFPKPTIARIQGPCLAGGMGLAGACDIAIASREATFGLPETRLGLIPSVISPYVLRAMGPRAAGRWFLTGETFNAAEALRIGFIHDVCEADELDARASAMMGSFMMAAPEALTEAKRLIREVPDAPINEQMAQDTATRIAQQRASAPGREGIAAFLEKRMPRWVRQC
jgi:methylglutaconyl-CoA hydratase